VSSVEHHKTIIAAIEEQLRSNVDTQITDRLNVHIQILDILDYFLDYFLDILDYLIVLH
jgi:hypothetical protein